MKIKLEQWLLIVDGVPIDLGWAWGTLDGDTLMRTCKGCGATVSGPVRREGGVIEVEPCEVSHRGSCPMWRRMEAQS